VERKLLYVEPVPEQAQRTLERSRRPDAVENAWLAISTLPRYETIRQDLEEVLARNETVRRLRSLVDQIESAAAALDSAGAPAAKLLPGQWVDMDTPELLAVFGRGYLTYHRLKIAGVTDDLAALLLAHFAVESGSAYDRSLRFLVRVWRDSEYGPGSPLALERGKADRENRFLLDFDVSYRIRRLRYLKRMVEEGICAGNRTQLGREIADKVTARLRDHFFQELRAIARGLTLPYRTLRRLGAAAEDLAVLGDLSALRKALELDPSERSARAALRDRGALVDEAARRVRTRYRAGFEKAGAEILALLDPGSAPNTGAALARELVRDVYDRFEDYDSITFPILKDGGVGELSAVEITRISPLDATRLSDESAGGRPKLRGTTLGNFGAFLDRGWRENDMLWGRLDGAERILTALLPSQCDRPLREQLIDEAHDLILREEMDRLLPASCAPPRERFAQFTAAQRTEPHRDLSARSIARSATVIGGMLDRIARDRRWEGLPFASLTRAGRLLWGLVEVAMPRSLNELFLQHWIKLLYLVEAALIVVGFLVPEAQALGVKLLLWTLAAHLAAALIRDYLLESRRATYAVASLAALALLALTAVGALEVWNVASSTRTARDLLGPWWPARLTGLIGAATLIMGWWMDRQPARLQYGAGERPAAPAIALEFAATAAEVHSIAGEVWHPNRRVFLAIREAAAWFTSGCALAFLGLAALAWRAGHGFTGSALAAAALLTVWFEWRQSRAIGRALGKPLAALDPPRFAPLAFAKWSSCFAALAAAALLSLSRAAHTGGSLWLEASGAIAALGAAAGFAGLLSKRLRLGLLPLAGIGLVLSLALWSLLLIAAPESLYLPR
jgi:hypothetical protein